MLVFLVFGIGEQKYDDVVTFMWLMLGLFRGCDWCGMKFVIVVDVIWMLMVLCLSFV